MLEITFARQAVQRAEDARLVTLRKQAAERELAAEKAKRDAQTQAQQSQLDAQQSQLAAERARAAQAEADADRARAEAAAAEAQARATAANKSASDANAVREKLRAQLNSVLATSEAARGLIVNMSDVLFDTGKYTLKRDADQPGQGRRNFGGLSGAEAASRGLYGQRRKRRLQPKIIREPRRCGEGVPGDPGCPDGQYLRNRLWQDEPVADNNTTQGRAQNRRVQLVARAMRSE